MLNLNYNILLKDIFSIKYNDDIFNRVEIYLNEEIN